MTGGIIPLSATLASNSVFESFIGDSKVITARSVIISYNVYLLSSVCLGDEHHLMPAYFDYFNFSQGSILINCQLVLVLAVLNQNISANFCMVDV